MRTRGRDKAARRRSKAVGRREMARETSDTLDTATAFSELLLRADDELLKEPLPKNVANTTLRRVFA